ncbi:hypothetical protein WN55_00800 [Dufourea novaeangliae]|uniref:Uncharacterized protein n=1 Tax=Dufourea novaeangliae TaxID=178035 RepID=A0A154PCZ9_DUFNO|nr:hypothetical protein WN55_00800 [Dufourea novaeangliae]
MVLGVIGDNTWRESQLLSCIILLGTGEDRGHGCLTNTDYRRDYTGLFVVAKGAGIGIRVGKYKEAIENTRNEEDCRIWRLEIRIRLSLTLDTEELDRFWEWKQEIDDQRVPRWDIAAALNGKTKNQGGRSGSTTVSVRKPVNATDRAFFSPQTAFPTFEGNWFLGQPDNVFPQGSPPPPPPLESVPEMLQRQ